jgi:hypothetical protein
MESIKSALPIVLGGGGIMKKVFWVLPRLGFRT